MKRVLITAIIIAYVVISCSVFQTAENFTRLKFRIHSANNYKLAGIQISNKKTAKDFSSVELLKLTSSLLQGKLPLTFNLNVEAKNPNEGSGGFGNTDLTIESFPWRLFIEDRETVAGNIKAPAYIPGKGENVIIRLDVEFDVAKIIKDKNLDNVLGLVLKLGGVGSSTSNIKLMTKPVIGTPIGSIQYPDEITIVDKSF
ncbi:MAG: hypothetical protein AB1521_00915 [Bacteroidota bacterium]